MLPTNILDKLKRYSARLNGNTVEFDLTEYQTIATEINKITVLLKNKSDSELACMSHILKTRARKNESPDILLVEAYSLVCETIHRQLGIDPFDVQIIGAIALHKGKLAEMQTGEGKTLTAVFPAYLNALFGKGVHVLTFNDYLAHRDATWMKPVYEFLGMSVGFILEEMSIADRQQAYAADITYLTAKEAGFDFLRDGLCYKQEDIVQRDFYYAIVDEADSILIDEARIPLVIAGNTEEHEKEPAEKQNRLLTIATLARHMKENEDFEFDEYKRNVYLTEKGMDHVEKAMSVCNMYEDDNRDILVGIYHAIHAEYLLLCDKDYLVRNGKVELIDECTGRIADKRKWPDGLHAAIEAKEHCQVLFSGSILNSITLQNFLSLYPKLCGMTATAQIAEEEFREFYNLHVAVIPAHKKCLRNDVPDVVYTTKKDKHDALVNEIIEVHTTLRPILVGTRSVKESAVLAQSLIDQGVVCEVLNAKQDENEAKIISMAGKLGSVTISTNMAGRGTDIRLGDNSEQEKEKILALGGLLVLGTNRHESLRIDNQLRGRAARQGDPGSSKFFISLHDDLFQKYRLHELIPSRYLTQAKSGIIDNPVVRNEINRVQRIIEGQNLEIKKTLCTYAFLVEKQRQLILQKRKEILFGTKSLAFFKENALDHYKNLTNLMGEESIVTICKTVFLLGIDSCWSHYLAAIADIRESIHVRKFGGQEPLFEFQKLTIHIFEDLQKNIDAKALSLFNTILPTTDPKTVLKDIHVPSATWTYLINDNPFDPMLAIHIAGNPGLSAWAALLWPLTSIFFLAKKLKRFKTKKRK